MQEFSEGWSQWHTWLLRSAHCVQLSAIHSPETPLENEQTKCIQVSYAVTKTAITAQTTLTFGEEKK